MKTSHILFIVFFLMISFTSCDLFNKDKDKDDDNSVGGEQSPMGDVGTTFSSASIAIGGVS